MKKRLLVYSLYFYPDVASIGQILTELCEGLQDDFDITVICAVPSYTGKIEEKYKGKRFYFEKYQKINIIRVSVPEFVKSNKFSRIKNILTYFINAVIATFKTGPQDIILTVSDPPILGGLLGVIGKKLKKCRLVYNIQDFSPEAIEAVGYIKSKFIISLLRKIDNFTCKRSDTVIVVGRDMQQTLISRFKGKKVPNNIVINNWADETKLYPLDKNHPKVLEFRKRYDLEDKFVIMYSGNLGLYYDLENIIKVFAEFKNREDIVFVFIGDGAVKRNLVSYVEQNNIKNIKFIPYQPKEELNYSLNAADVHIVCNAKGIKGVSVPSKVYSAIAVRKPIIGILEEGSEARLLIEELNCGKCTNPGDYDGIKAIIQEFILNKNELSFYTKDIRLSKLDSINKYREVLNRLLNE
jgi:glycosyltransferase involved in cell wall biosynthesis